MVDWCPENRITWAKFGASERRGRWLVVAYFLVQGPFMIATVHIGVSYSVLKPPRRQVLFSVLQLFKVRAFETGLFCVFQAVGNTFVHKGAAPAWLSTGKRHRVRAKGVDPIIMRQVCFSLRQSLMLLKPHLGSFYSLTVTIPSPPLGLWICCFLINVRRVMLLRNQCIEKEEQKNQVNKAGSPAFPCLCTFPPEVQRLSPIWNDLFTILCTTVFLHTLKVQPRLLHPCPCHPWPLAIQRPFTKSSQT